jgi:mannose-6-phosphate isomerase-like protein (cupin superfamily)
MFEAPSDGAVVRFDSLDPRWGTMHAREPGHYRWLISYYGGGEGYLNENRSTGLISDRGHAGIMHLTSGCRQFGVHEHTVTEIYVILQGEVESIEPGRTQKAGPLDALYMPPTAPHAVRASGEEDVVLFFCHDASEQIGKSIYYDESDDRWSSATPQVQVVRWSELRSRRDKPGANVGGTMRSWTAWAGAAGGDAAIGPNAAANDLVSLGTTEILPGNAHAVHSHPFAEHYVVISGRAAVLDRDDGAILGPRDYVGFASGTLHGLRAVGVEPVRVLWLQEGQGDGVTSYEKAGAPSSA